MTYVLIGAWVLGLIVTLVVFARDQHMHSREDMILSVAFSVVWPFTVLLGAALRAGVWLERRAERARARRVRG